MLSFPEFATRVTSLMAASSQEVRDELELVWFHYRRGQVLYNDLLSTSNLCAEAQTYLGRCLECHHKVWQGLELLASGGQGADLPHKIRGYALDMSVAAIVAEELTWRGPTV